KARSRLPRAAITTTTSAKPAARISLVLARDLADPAADPNRSQYNDAIPPVAARRWNSMPSPGATRSDESASFLRASAASGFLPAICYSSQVVLDTSPEALRAQTEAQRRLGGPQRFRTACMMSQTLRTLAIARILAGHPDLDERGILDHLMVELYGFRRGA
ncbi:hypothetical protein ACFL5O_10115, partial [Myxococcota bacterium]